MTAPVAASPGALRSQIRSAVLWRSGTQVFSQVIAWLSTLLVMRLLPLADYGLFAMTASLLMLLSLLNGFSFAQAAIQDPDCDHHRLRQLFGLLIVVNGALALAQVLLAPLVAAYYQEPRVTALLQVQALLYLINPFLALGYAVLSRALDFRRQAQANLVSALVGAAVALGGAWAGWGVWALVLSSLALFTVRAAGLMLAARAWFWPSFDFRGAGALAGYGGVAMGGQLFWFVQSQSDVVIAGRALGASELGLYTVSLFLAQIFVTKVVPPLNEVAFSAYARLRADPAAIAEGFCKSVRVVMLLALPFSLGMAATAGPLVETVLGSGKLAAAPVVALLALAMPWLTLHVLFAPATNACGHPGIATRCAILGAVLMPAAYLAGVRHGAVGLAAAWAAAYPLFTALSARWSLPVIGLRAADLWAALRAPALAGLAMAGGVVALDHALPVLPATLRLATLVAAGAALYGGLLWIAARERLTEVIDLLIRR